MNSARSITVYPNIKCHSLQFLFGPQDFFVPVVCLPFCCIKHRLPHLAFQAGAWPCPYQLLDLMASPTDYCWCKLCLVLHHARMEGAVLSIRICDVVEYTCPQPNKESHLGQVGLHRVVKFPFSHAFQPDRQNLAHLHLILYLLSSSE